MVNTGHPSRACKLCRTRRIRCDETKPACLKCQKSKRVCPGYRDPFEVNLRDETAATIRKAKAAHQRRTSPEAKEAPKAKSPPATPPSQTTTSTPESAWASPSTTYSSTASSVAYSSTNVSVSYGSTATSVEDISSPSRSNAALENALEATQSGSTLGYVSKYSSLPMSLQTTLEDQAACYFLSNYVLSATRGVGRGICTFLVPLLNRADVKDSPLPMAFSATSMAALAGRPSARSLLPQAHTYYSRALKEINTALQDRNRALLDHSIAAVVLLSFYEGLAASDDPFRAWSNHLNGAKALVKLRHQSNIPPTEESIEIFGFVRSLMVRQYMFGFVASPPSHEEIKWWGENCVMDKMGHIALLLNMKTTLVRADADALLTPGPRTAHKIEQVLDLLRRAKETATELSRWIERVQGRPDLFEKAVAGWADEVPEGQIGETSVFPGKMYSFHNFWVAAKHLNTDASRIILAGIIVRITEWICAPSDHTRTVDYLEAKHIGQEAVNNIVASVPYFLSWAGDPITTPFFPCGTAERPKGFAGITCLWPLFTTGVSVFATPKQKKYIQGRLNAMSENMGIKPAETLAKNQRSGQSGERALIGHVYHK
ncbi:hypothetical protein GQ53DRAFT_770222 [Thozetella sp. PMI_491]|nr:hypothetical protein GQ53DRAFT_770222 [Thozetella sp. PMI_491]